MKRIILTILALACIINLNNCTPKKKKGGILDKLIPLALLCGGTGNGSSATDGGSTGTTANGTGGTGSNTGGGGNAGIGGSDSGSGNVTPTLTITSFTPNTAAVGDTVTITGTNFSASTSSNTVQFNGTTATVSVATTTSLTVTVPIGATTGTISVTTGTNMVTSAGSFTVRLCSTSSSVTYNWGTFTEMCDGTIKFVGVSGNFGGQAYTAQTLYFAKCSYGQTYNSTNNTCDGTATATQYCSGDNRFCDDGTVLNGTGTSGAFTAYNGLNFGGGTYGKTNWRVPTKNELKTLIHFTDNTMPLDMSYCGSSNYTSPSVNNLFPNTPSDIYWSSSANNSNKAWFVSFHYGFTNENPKSSNSAVRCVTDAD